MWVHVDSPWGRIPTRPPRPLVRRVRVIRGAVVPPRTAVPVSRPKWRICPGCLEDRCTIRGRRVAALIDRRLYCVCEDCIHREPRDPVDVAYEAYYG